MIVVLDPYMRPNIQDTSAFYLSRQHSSQNGPHAFIPSNLPNLSPPTSPPLETNVLAFLNFALSLYGALISTQSLREMHHCLTILCPP